MDREPPQIAIIGGGIVGLSSALWLQEKRFHVTLVDGSEPGSGTSSGNACTIADYGCIPVNNPSLPARLPSLAFGRESPLRVDPLYAITHLPWMLSFLRHCSRTQVDHTIAALGSILRHTDEGLDPLLALSGSEDLLKTNGCMYVYQSAEAFRAAAADNQRRREQGAEFSELSRDQIYDLEPGLKPVFSHGILFPNARQVSNPGTLCKRYFQAFLNRGGHYLSENAKGIVHNSDGVEVCLDGGSSISVHKVVISSGACSRSIKGSGAGKLPLDTERGYHVQYAGQQGLVNRPVAWAECGFYATNMDQGLRFAGTVEIAGLSNTPRRRNIEFLRRKSCEMFQLDSEGVSEWLGFRPTLPDALPVIGPASDSPNTLYAFGHQHIGLTLAGITGKLIAELASGESPSVDITPYLADRFTKTGKGRVSPSI